MTLQIWFWLLMVLWLVFGLWGEYAPDPYKRVGWSLLLFFIIGIIGWKLFGSPVQH